MRNEDQGSFEHLSGRLSRHLLLLSSSSVRWVQRPKLVLVLSSPYSVRWVQTLQRPGQVVVLFSSVRWAQRPGQVVLTAAVASSCSDTMRGESTFRLKIFSNLLDIKDN